MCRHVNHSVLACSTPRPSGKAPNFPRIHLHNLWTGDDTVLCFVGYLFAWLLVCLGWYYDTYVLEAEPRHMYSIVVVIIYLHAIR